MGRAQRNGYAEICLHNLRDYTTDKHRKTGDYQFGGCAGLVMKIEPIDNCIKHLKSQRNYDEVIYTTPDGQVFDQPMANSLSMKENLIFLCGHYKGIDHRIREHLITKEISIGDYVLTGGELAALVVIDATARFIDGVLGSVDSAYEDSFSDGLLEAPQYTRPSDFNGMKVPDVLLNGNHKLIEEFRMQQKIERTKAKRPDLYQTWLKKNK
jgi:tRNA (guanine37-N1)-methyltransferase